MALGIYKAGQGYWVRVLSAVALGILTMAASAWAWGQAGAVRLPIAAYSYNVVGVTGQVQIGDVVEIRASNPQTGEIEAVGSGTVQLFEPGSVGDARIRLGAFTADKTREMGLHAKQLVVGDFRAAVRESGVTSIPIFNPIYLQAGAAGVLMLLGAFIIFWFVGFGRKPVDFLVATDGEMKKVNWSTPREIRGSTIVVIVAAFLIAGILFGVDMAFRWFFGAIDVLQS